jgi:uncharacterized membrane protein
MAEPDRRGSVARYRSRYRLLPADGSLTRSPRQSPPWRIVVIADFLFTATAVITQPATGIALAAEGGYSLREGWVLLSMLLYLATGAFWLLVVWMSAPKTR